jgi:hypothetical protein
MHVISAGRAGALALAPPCQLAGPSARVTVAPAIRPDRAHGGMLRRSMAKYPLEPLASLREKKADEAGRALATAVAERERAGRALRAAEQRREAHARAVERVRTEESKALGRGELRAADLARADAWRLRTNAEAATLAGAVERALAAETKATQEVRAAQGGLALRRAEVNVVASGRARWEAERARHAEAREEEASFEAWRPKR